VIEKNFNLTESCKINGDENQLKQVFINIIKNGIEAMPAGGVINISSEKKGSYTIISIKDQGSGMTKENMKQIGEPFFSTKEKGTGLGLPICLRILKEHKGELKIESESGKGSTFYVILPLESDK
jgi:signal transduction histidine kinase